jgi:hypothetical protein
LFLLSFHALPPCLFGQLKKIQLPSDNGGVFESNQKNFNRHLTYPHCRMVTEEFWSPSNKPTPLDGDQNFLITQKGK